MDRILICRSVGMLFQILIKCYSFIFIVFKEWNALLTPVKLELQNVQLPPTQSFGYVLTVKEPAFLCSAVKVPIGILKGERMPYRSFFLS